MVLRQLLRKVVVVLVLLGRPRRLGQSADHDVTQSMGLELDCGVLLGLGVRGGEGAGEGFHGDGGLPAGHGSVVKVAMLISSRLRFFL